MTNCQNCGAPLRGHVCEYCGSVYGDNTKISFDLISSPTTSACTYPIVVTSECKTFESVMQEVKDFERLVYTDYSRPTEVMVLCTKCHAKVHLKPPVTATCVVCGKEFVAKWHRKTAKICSQECLAEFGRISARKRWNTSGMMENQTLIV